MKRFNKEMTKRILLTICIVFFSVISFATNYYVSNSGNDSNSGTSAATPWLTISKINGASLVAGDSILFKRGDSWFGQLLPKNGTSGGQITYGAYGIGAKPLLHQSVLENSTSDWTEESPNVWKNNYVLGTEMCLNTSFNTDVSTGWGSWINIANGASGSKSRSTTEYYSGPASLQFNIINNGITTNDIYLAISNLIFEADKTYQLTFYAKATSAFRVPSMGAYNGSFNPVTTLDITTSWVKYTVLLPSKRTGIEHILFFLGNAIPDNTSFYLDDVSLKEIPKFLSNDVGNVIFNNEQSVGVKKWNKTDITTQGQYWYDKTNNLLYLYSTSNPASYYSDIRACLKSDIILLDSKNYITIDNLAIKYGASCGINGLNSNNLNITNCDVSWIGGGDFGAPTRFGNGITFYYSAQNILVENCRVWEIYDAGISNQYQPTEGTIVQSNITYKNNTIWNCEYSFEYFNRSKTGETSNIYFENNTCYNAGGGWSHAQRPDPSGHHLRLAGTPDNTTNFVIKNNIFSHSTSAIHRNWDTSGKYTIDYNCIFQPIGNVAFLTGTYYSSFALYKTATNWDLHSINSDPLFTNISNLDFSLASNSPCIDAGDPISSFDHDGTRADIGAFYFDHTFVKTSITFTEYKSICDGASYNGWTTTGKYERTLIAKSGSDSIVTTFLTVNPKYSVTEDVTISEGEEYKGWTETGKYTRNLTSVLGCDSIVTTNLTVESLIIKQGSIPPTHFIPSWNGENGLNHMNLMVVSATLEDIPLSANDEIAVFSGSLCVGSAKLSIGINPEKLSTYLTISASQNDGSSNGFTDNDTIIFKIWDHQNQKEVIAKSVKYRSEISGWLTNGKYVAGGTSVVEIVSYTEYTQSISLVKGYNMISTYLESNDANVSSLTKTLVDSGSLVKVQDETGNSYENWGTFGGWINNVGSVQKTEGYKIKVANNCTLQIAGRPIALPLDINLKAGWNIISFPRTDMIDALLIVQPLIDGNKLVKVQDEKGNSIEDWGIYGGWKNGIGNFIPGRAYKVKMSADAVITIHENYLKSSVILASNEQPEYFSTRVEGNGSEHVNINIVGLSRSGIVAGDELAAFDGDICVGALKVAENHIIDGSASLVASISSAINTNDGFTEGHAIRIIAWNKLTGDESEVQADVINGQLKYAKNSSVLLNIKSLTTQFHSFQDIVAIDVFPNPSQGKVTVRFSNFPDAGSSIEILDISGRKIVSRIVTGMSEVFNLDQQPAGVYLVKSKLGSKETVQKLVIN